MKKIRTLFLISSIMGAISSILCVFSYLEVKEFNKGTIYEISSLISLIASIVITILYIKLLTYKNETALEKKWILISISVCSLLTPILVMFMTFATINSISNYLFEKRMKQSQIILLRPQTNIKNANIFQDLNSNEVKANIIAKEYKKLKDLRDGKIISEEEYEKSRNELLSKIGIDPSNIEEIDATKNENLN